MVQKTFLVLFLFSDFAFATKPNCTNPNALLIEYRSVISNQKIKSCQIKINGNYIKEGPTYYYNSTDKLLKTEYFKNNQRFTPPKPKQPNGFYPQFSDISGYICRLTSEKLFQCYNSRNPFKYGLSSTSKLNTLSPAKLIVPGYQNSCVITSNNQISCMNSLDRKFIDYTNNFIKHNKIVEFESIQSSTSNFCIKKDNQRILCSTKISSSSKNRNVFHSLSIKMDENIKDIDYFKLNTAYANVLSLCILSTEKKLYCRLITDTSNLNITITKRDQITKRKVAMVDTGQSRTCYLSAEGDIECFKIIYTRDKNYRYSQDQHVMLKKKAKMIHVIRSTDACAILNDSSVQCWKHEYKNTVYNTQRPPTIVMTPYKFPPNAKSIMSNFDFACAIYNDSLLFCNRLKIRNDKFSWSGHINF